VARAFVLGLMEENIRDNGKTENKMVKEKCEILKER
jgi:hypothetical protein